MGIKYAESIYSFRNLTSLVSEFVGRVPDAATLAQIESDLANAATAFYQRRYNDSIDYYKQAGILIYRYLDPLVFTTSSRAYGKVSRDNRLFDPLLSVASEYMNVLPIPTADPVRPGIAVDQAALGDRSIERAGIRSTTLNTPTAQRAAADMQAASHFRDLGQIETAKALETRANQTDPNTAALFKTTQVAPSSPVSPILHLRSAIAGTSGAGITGVSNLISDVRLPTVNVLPKSLPSGVLEGRTVGIANDSAISQISWNPGQTPDLNQLKSAAYTSRVNTTSVIGDVLLNPQEPSDVALALPHDYYYTIPLGIAEALHAMGDYANAELYYFQATAYQFLNKAVEAPYLFLRIATLYLDWGNSYFIDDDAATALPIYERVIGHDRTSPVASPLYNTTSLGAAADVAKQIITNIQNTHMLPNTINPALVATILECYAALIKIVNSLDFWGSTTNNVPIWTFNYLQNVAINFAELAIGVEKDFISYQDRADQGTLSRLQIVQTLDQSNAEVNAAQLQADAASAETSAYQNGLDLANTREANAQSNVTAFTAASWDQIQYQAESSQVQGGDDGDPGNINRLADQLLSGNTISDSRGTVGAATQLAGAKRNRDYEIGSLQRTSAEMHQAAVQAQAELNAATARATAAQAQVTIAQLRAKSAQAMLDQFDSQFFTPDVWYAMGATMYRLYQRYFNMAIRIAKEMQKAYNFETDQLLHWIRPSYAPDEVKGLLGADALMADIQQFTYDLVTATKSKPQPLRHTISLAGEYPFMFETQFRKTGSMDFETRVDDFDTIYPGTYAGRIESIEVAVDGIVPVTGLSGTLTNTGISVYRVPSTSLPQGVPPGVKFRLQSKETLILSDFTVRDDSLLFTTDNRMLRIFEGAGVASSWHLEIPRSINDIDFGAIIDVRLTFYYRARYDNALKSSVLAHLATLPGVTRKARSIPIRWFYPDAFFAFQAGGTLSLTLRPRDFGRNQTQPKLANVGLLVTTDGSKPASGIKLSLTCPGHAAIALLTDVNGVIASGGGNPLASLAGASAVGNYVVAMTAAENPGFITGGKLDLSSIVNITLMFEYDFTPRT